MAISISRPQRSHRDDIGGVRLGGGWKSRTDRTCRDQGVQVDRFGDASTRIQAPDDPVTMRRRMNPLVGGKDRHEMNDKPGLAQGHAPVIRPQSEIGRRRHWVKAATLM